MGNSPTCTCPATVSSARRPDLTSRILRHERALVAVSLLLLGALAWWYIAAGALGRPTSMAAMSAQSPPIGALVVMWCLMMVAMMLPSAAPAILLYARVRAARSHDTAIAKTWVFLAGYLATWLLFSVVAAFVQLALTRPSMSIDNRFAQSTVLIAAGLYQLSPLKSACLSQCRSPGQFISRHWRPGWDGAVQLGLRHGAYCVGCCWLLMSLLFVAGVMNLLWVVALAVLVAIEKLVPRGDWLGRAAGVGLLLWGASRALA
jgi:predicted metal-binding membrane protein